MAEKTDLRVVRTKQMLRDALFELMAEKGFEALNIRDLTQRAGVNRGTFYLHYKDKYDLLEQSTEEEMSGLIDIMQQFDPRHLLAHDTLDKPYPIALMLFEYLAEHSEFFNVTLGPKGDQSHYIRVRDIVKKNLYAKLATLRSAQSALLVDDDFFAAYVTSAHLGVIQHWLATGMAKSPYQMAVLFTRISKLGPMQAAIGTSYTDMN